MPDFATKTQEKTDRELLEMIYQFDQWSPAMLAAVEAELSNRKILPEDFSARRRQIIDTEELAMKKGKEASLAGVVIGWLTVFGLFGIVIGYTYAFSKVTSPHSGETYFKYDETSRSYGSYLFYTSLVLSSAAIIYKLTTL